jgi:hypothetical protein
MPCGTSVYVEPIYRSLAYAKSFLHDKQINRVFCWYPAGFDIHALSREALIAQASHHLCVAGNELVSLLLVPEDRIGFA